MRKRILAGGCALAVGLAAAGGGYAAARDDRPAPPAQHTELVAR